jgi:hypothetical protein
MSRRELDSFASGLGEVIANLRNHLDSRRADQSDQ